MPPTTWQQFEDAAKFFTRDGMFGTDVKGAVETEYLATLGRLMAESHASMRDDFGITVPETYGGSGLDLGKATPCALERVGDGVEQRRDVAGEVYVDHLGPERRVAVKVMHRECTCSNVLTCDCSKFGILNLNNADLFSHELLQW